MEVLTRRKAKGIPKISNIVKTGLRIQRQVFREVQKLEELLKIKTGSQTKRNKCSSSNRIINKRRVGSAAEFILT